MIFFVTPHICFLCSRIIAIVSKKQIILLKTIFSSSHKSLNVVSHAIVTSSVSIIHFLKFEGSRIFSSRNLSCPNNCKKLRFFLKQKQYCRPTKTTTSKYEKFVATNTFPLSFLDARIINARFFSTFVRYCQSLSYFSFQRKNIL